jgi:hypothetical protein
MATRLVPILVLCTLVGLLAPGGASGQILSDGFETYVAGTYPGSPWYTIFDGESAFVTDAVAHAGSKSFCVRSLPNWSRWECVNVGTVPDQVGYQGAVMVEAAGRGGALGFGYVVPGIPNEGRWANAMMFGNDGSLSFSTRTKGFVVVGTWTPGVWYEVGVYLDFSLELASLFVNGTLVASGVPADPKVLPASVHGSPVPLDQFGILGDNFSGGGVGTMYLDSVFMGDPIVGATSKTWGAIKNLYR